MDLGSVFGLFYLDQALEEQGLLQDWETHESHRGREGCLAPLPRNAAPVRLDFETMSRPFFLWKQKIKLGAVFPVWVPN